MFEYKYPKADNTSTVAPIYFSNMEMYILLGKRRDNVDTFPGQWCLPGGFLNIGTETTEQCAVRELKEETGIDYMVEDLVLYHVHSGPNTDPRGHVVNTCYVAYLSLTKALNAVAGDDIAELKGFLVNDVTEMNLAFNHNDLAERAIRRGWELTNG